MYMVNLNGSTLKQFTCTLGLGPIVQLVVCLTQEPEVTVSIPSSATDSVSPSDDSRRAAVS